MHSRSLTRLMLATVLAIGIGLVTEATALASAPGKSATTAAEKKKKKKSTTIKLASSSLGKIIVDSKGKTLYALDLETSITSPKCRAGCDSLWPELKASKPTVGKGLDKTKVAVGADGQVAYNGHLLYHYKPDAKPGDTGGQGIAGVWHALGPDGNPVKS
jgi:predicted lipoprotein with Yx(FWY)xxD motif